MGLVSSGPGSVAQPWHADGVPLFPGDNDLPAHALNCFAPIVNVSRRMGPTEFVARVAQAGPRGARAGGRAAAGPRAGRRLLAGSPSATSWSTTSGRCTAACPTGRRRSGPSSAVALRAAVVPRTHQFRGTSLFDRNRDRRPAAKKKKKRRRVCQKLAPTRRLVNAHSGRLGRRSAFGRQAAPSVPARCERSFRRSGRLRTSWRDARRSRPTSPGAH